MTGDGHAIPAVPLRDRAVIRAAVRAWVAHPTNRTLLLNLGILLTVGVVLSLATDRFLTVENLSNVVRQVSFVGITASAVTLVMVSGGLDLSVGSIVAVAGVVAAKFAAEAGWPLVPSFLLGAIAGGLFGTLNAFLVVAMRINPVIATLGTLYIGRGLALLLAGGEPVKGVPLAFNDLATGTIGPLSLPVVIFVCVAGSMLVIERKTLIGRWAIASGGNSEAARLSGIPIDRTRAILYVLSGPNSGVGFEFDVIVAIVLGGTALSGGQGSVVGTVVGVLIVGILGNGLNLLGVQSFSQYIVKGVVLLIAVGSSEVIRRISRRFARP